MSNSFAQSIAGGTQDLAALAGLFCTDGVERNALSVQAGYVAIAVSSLSLLGILGLVRSAVKVALGLRRCSNAGFNLDSLRSLYGYLPEEADASKDMVECDLVEVSFERCLPGKTSPGANPTDKDEAYHSVVISKEKRFYNPQLTPIVYVGSDWPEKLHSKTAVNLGNLRREMSFRQSPYLIGFILFFCPGVTAWLLLVVSSAWNWVTLVAIVGLHVSLSILLALPVWHGRNMSQAGIHLSATVWKVLTEGKPSPEENSLRTLSFLQARVADGNVLHSTGNRKFLRSELVQGMVLVPASICAIAYLCQYAVLTKASNTRSLIWVGCQVLLALIRVFFWILDPQFDNLSLKQTEYAIFNNTRFKTSSLIEMMCACTPGPEATCIPRWVWEYLLENDLASVLVEATPHLLATTSDMKVQESYALLDIDFERIIRQRLPRPDSTEPEPPLWRLGMNKLENGMIQPFVMIQTSYQAGVSPSEIDKRAWLEPCWIQVVADAQSLLRKEGKDTWFMDCPRSLAAFDQSGNQISVQPFKLEKKCPSDCRCASRYSISSNDISYEENADSWRSLYDRGERACRHIREDIEGLKKGGQSVNVFGDALWRVATPGTTDRAGKLHPLRGGITHTWGNGIYGDVKDAVGIVGEYIQKGLHNGHKQDEAGAVATPVNVAGSSAV